MTDDINKWIAGRACEALAQLSHLYDPEGKEAEALTCDWSGTPDGAGELTAQRVVSCLTAQRGVIDSALHEISVGNLYTAKKLLCGLLGLDPLAWAGRPDSAHLNLLEEADALEEDARDLDAGMLARLGGGSVADDLRSIARRLRREVTPPKETR